MLSNIIHVEIFTLYVKTYISPTKNMSSGNKANGLLLPEVFQLKDFGMKCVLGIPICDTGLVTK